MNDTNRKLVTAGVMLATFLAALDVTVVGTAMPTIIGNLGGMALYSWVFSSYMLTSTATVPVYGRLADLYGRKPIFFLGVGLFLLGSVLCGLAQNMEQLILYRALQGVGAGGVAPITITIIGDIFSPEQRAKVQGLFSGVWGISSIVGPVIGGIFVEQFDWRWVFYVNLPFGLMAILMIALFLQEKVERSKVCIDYAGSLYLVSGSTVLLLMLLMGGKDFPWFSLESLGLLSGCIVLSGLFIWNEAKCSDPMLPLSLFRDRIISVSNLAGLSSGAVMMGMASYLPLFVQGVMQGSALDAGAALAPMAIGWPLGSIFGGRLILKFGYRLVAIAGMVFIVIGSWMLSLTSTTTPQTYIVVVMIVVGLGMGLSSLAFLLAVQNMVGWAQRGVATATLQFSRSMGGAVGVAMLGAVLNGEMLTRVEVIRTGLPAAKSLEEGLGGTRVLLTAAARESVAPDILLSLQTAFSDSLHLVFFLIIVIALLGVLASFFFPRVFVKQI